MAKRHRADNQAQMDELDNGRGETGPDSAGQSGDTQQLSTVEDAADESVEELADEDQSMEASAVEGLEDAADHPERPVHTHEDYGRPEDQAPWRKTD
ncbi:MAG TPA: hypothetical protein VGG04_14960 [Candidatus Sulfotelmatobacter sp.]|jgi:hypothetical protein